MLIMCYKIKKKKNEEIGGRKKYGQDNCISLDYFTSRK